MDAKEFLKVYNRMCTTLKTQHKCNKEDCPIGRISTWDPNKIRPSCYDIVCKCYSEAVDIVEEWSKENPAKTRQLELLKIFPKAETDEEGVVMLCPAKIDSSFKCRINNATCSQCCKDYWSEEIE